MNKTKTFILILFLIAMIGCSDKKSDDKTEDQTYAQINLVADSKTIGATEFEDTRGIKLYPDTDFWHLNFQYKGNQINHPVIFTLKKNIVEGEVLKPADDGVKVVFREDSGTFVTSKYNNDFTVTVDKWQDSNVQLTFSGKVWDGGITNRTLSGSITTVIDRNPNPAYFSSFDYFDDYNEDGTIVINMTAYTEVILAGECNSSLGGSNDKYLLNVPAGSYEYKTTVFNLAQGSIARVINPSTSTVLSSIHNAPYLETLTAAAPRLVSITQGNYWFIGGGGDYKVVIKKSL